MSASIYVWRSTLLQSYSDGLLIAVGDNPDHARLKIWRKFNAWIEGDKDLDEETCYQLHPRITSFGDEEELAEQTQRRRNEITADLVRDPVMIVPIDGAIFIDGSS